MSQSHPIVRSFEVTLSVPTRPPSPSDIAQKLNEWAGESQKVLHWAIVKTKTQPETCELSIEGSLLSPCP